MTALLFKRQILFFGPKTFNYEREIVRALEGQGATVIYMSDKPWDAAWLKALLRLFPRLAWLKADEYYQAWLLDRAPQTVDEVLIIKGEGLSPRTLRNLRAKYPKARFLLYLWDSISNVRGTEGKLPYFDARFSFDRDDCKNHPQFKYRPLFFLEQYRNSSGSKVDGSRCFFLGTLNGDRPKVLRRILDSLKKPAELDYWLFVRNGFELKLRMLFDKSLRGLDPTRLIRRPLASADIADRLAGAAAVVDIEHPKQAGLTMRTFEVLASGRKLITTNKRIELEEFFNPDRILVIDRQHPIVPDGFLRSQATPLPDEFFARYSVDGWLRDLFSEDDTASARRSGG